jgi:hypothetical protein
LKVLSPLKFNHDIVVPKARIPELFELVERLRQESGLRIPCFGHVGDGNIHVNVLVNPDSLDEQERGHRAERALFEGVVALEGSISGEHGIGFAKAQYLGIELTPDEIALMQRVKRAFDPNGILNSKSSRIGWRGERPGSSETVPAGQPSNIGLNCRRCTICLSAVLSRRIHAAAVCARPGRGAFRHLS